MNEEELTMLAQEDTREELSAQELMRPITGGDRDTGEALEDEAEESGGLMDTAEDDDQEEVTDAQRAAREAVADYRAALERLMDDGWTMQELEAMIADGEVLRALEQGETLSRAATAYMRRGAQVRRMPKRGVPTFRAQATEDMRDDDPIARMTDAEFAAFSRRAKEAALAGKRIRLG